MELQPTTQLQQGKYSISKTLGKGGFGITYLGEQVALSRKVAIKEFFMSDCCSRESDSHSVTVTMPQKQGVVDEFKARFFKEARILAELKHPNIVNIIDVFEENNTSYYVMEHIEGSSLKKRMGNPMDEKEASAIIKQVGNALDYVHSHNILHLDVKPDNIMMRNDGTPILIDFGISKRYDESGSQTSFSTMGTSRGYAPIEQYNPDSLTTFRPATDIYALGATFYFLLTGENPPESNVVLSQGLPSLPSNVSKDTKIAITAAMRPSRADRPQTVTQFLAMLSGEVADVNTTAPSNMRYLIEQLEANKQYKQAYNLCIDCIEQGKDVEFAQEKSKEYVKLLWYKSEGKNALLTTLGIIVVIVILVLTIVLRMRI